MTADEKLARIVESLATAGIDVLVLGGHAVRYYGIDRNTNDFDLVTALTTPDELSARLPTVDWLRHARAVPVWRAGDFARFEIGRLPDGREEWLEFWLRNHLLTDFPTLKSRAEIGRYGGASVPFLSLPDLLKSKETERETDWHDIRLLEEVQDARHLAVAARGEAGARLRLLSSLRSRRGMDRAVEQGLLDDREAVAEAIGACHHPVPFAFLAPLDPRAVPGDVAALPADLQVVASLRSVPLASHKHFALIEIVRRNYKRQAMERDRSDKQARLGHP